jgi:transcriptional regulator GlxA family with amidase domain
MRADTVAVVALDGVSPFHLSVPFLVFGEDRSDEGVPRMRVLVCGERRGLLRTTAGFSIQCEHGLEAISRATIVIVPAWRDVQQRVPAKLLEALRRAHRRGATVVGLCLGAFVLAEAGLLDGRAATTHWRYADEFARRFPAVRCEPGVLYVDEGTLLTSAGTAAGIDCCLHLLRRRMGSELANRVARRMVVPPHRQGSQAQFVEAPLPSRAGGDRLAKTLDWARGHLDQALDVDTLAGRSLMSRRTFTRRFRETTGASVTQWLNAERLARAQRLLETTKLSIDEVASASGFGSPLSMRQHFARSLRTAPSAYRREFQGGA